MTDNPDLPKNEEYPINSAVEGIAEKKGAKTSGPTEGPIDGRDRDGQELSRLRQSLGRRPLFRS